MSGQDAKAAKPTTVDGYIAQFESPVRERLEELRALIRQIAPDAEEVISYGIPAYRDHGWLAYFAGYRKHVSLSIPPDTLDVMRDRLTGYKSSKAAVQFPLDAPLPADLIRELVEHRLATNRGEAAKAAGDE